MDTTLEKPENTDKLSLTDDANFVKLDGTAEEMNVESLVGMLEDLYKTLPRLNELDVAFDMDEVEMVEEEHWDDNDSDLDADFDSGASEDE